MGQDRGASPTGGPLPSSTRSKGADAGPIYANRSPRRIRPMSTRLRAPPRAGLSNKKPALLVDLLAATATFRRRTELFRLRCSRKRPAKSPRARSSRGRDLVTRGGGVRVVTSPPGGGDGGRRAPGLSGSRNGVRKAASRTAEAALLSDRGEGLPDGRAGSSVSIRPLLRAPCGRRASSSREPAPRRRVAGLTQLMPATAKSPPAPSCAQRYPRGALYDLGVNARLGAAYFGQLLNRFGGKTLRGRAYNGPTRMARVLMRTPTTTTTRSSSPTPPTRPETTCAASCSTPSPTASCTSNHAFPLPRRGTGEGATSPLLFLFMIDAVEFHVQTKRKIERQDITEQP